MATGQLGDMFGIIVVLVVVIMSTLVAAVVLNQINSETTDFWSGQNVSQESMDAGKSMFASLTSELYFL